MKRAVSISIGSRSRDKRVVTNLLGEDVIIERIGTDGDEEKAYRLFCELDGEVDAFGVGGIDLQIHAIKRDYPLYAGLKLVRDVNKTPVVDGGGLKATLEARVIIEAGYKITFGDLMFGLGIPIPINTVPVANLAAAILLPIVGRMPIEMLYPFQLWAGCRLKCSTPPEKNSWKWFLNI